MLVVEEEVFWWWSGKSGGDFKTVGGGGGGSRFDSHFSDKKIISTLGYNEGGGYIKIWGPY